MKTAHCLECDQHKQVPDYLPDKIICEECCGPWNSASKPSPEGHLHSLLLHGPQWVYGNGRGWTQEKAYALAATDEARAAERWRIYWDDYHKRFFEEFSKRLSNA